MSIGKEILVHFSSYPVFTHRDVSLYFTSRKIKPTNLNRVLSYLKSVGKIKVITKGVYALKRDDSLVGFAFQPFYYGLLYALTIRELWTQNARPEVVTLKTVKRSEVVVFGDSKNRIILHHSRPAHFFGFSMLKYGGINIPVSDPEKTLIDLFYYKARMPIQDYNQLLTVINKKKLSRYLAAYDRHTKMVVNNFISKYRDLAKAGGLENPY